MKIGTNLGSMLANIRPKPQPRTRRAELAPLTDAELAARYADASARKRAREDEHRRLHPVTFTIAHRR